MLSDARSDYDKALAIDPAAAEAWLGRARLGQIRGERELARGQDPQSAFAEALRDLEQAIALDPCAAQARYRRGLLYADLGETAQAVADLETDAHLNPRVNPRLLAQLRELRARLATAAAAPAQPRTGEAGDRDPAFAPGLHLLDSARALAETGAYAEARVPHDEGLRLAEEALAALPAEARARALPPVGDGGLRAPLRRARYDLACVLATLSAGRAGRDAAPVAIAPEDAARPRDDAFRHLEAALDLGWADRRKLEQDPDLAPLRADARWEGVASRIR